MSTIIIGTLVLAIFTLPFFIVQYGNSSGRKHLKESLHRLANEYHCKVKVTDYWADTAIGLDEESAHLFFVHAFKGNEKAQHLNMSDYSGCRLKNLNRNIKDKQGDHRAIDRLEVELIPLVKGKPAASLEFFSSEGGKLHSNELMMAEKWVSLINSKLPSGKG